MLKKVPQAGTRISFADLRKGAEAIFFNAKDDFAGELAAYLPSEKAILVGSGSAAFYLILEALKEFSSKKEVVLPAYTAPTVLLPVLKAGLEPVLCDITLRDFNIDLDLLPGVVTQDTLCVVATHLFGIPVSGMAGLKNRYPGIYIIEDCAQSMGTKIVNKNTGKFGDIAFSSFNRGKNLSTYGGGGIFTENIELAEAVKKKAKDLPEQGICFALSLLMKQALLSWAIKPWAYGALYPFISYFKDNRVHEDFSLEKFTSVQSGMGLALLKNIESFSETRNRNGIKILEGLKDIQAFILPSPPCGTRPAFNRLPVLCKDLALRERLEKKLFRKGFDTSRMYERPLHHIFELGYKKEEFPNATYLAEHLITVPVHPLVRDKDTERLIKAVLSVI
jgi:perosamine synthetase